MSVMVSQITGVSRVYWTVCSGADERKHQSSVSLAFVRGIHWWPVNSLYKGPVTRNVFPFDDVIMIIWTNAGPLDRLFDAKPLPEPMLAYCQLDFWEQILVKFEFCHFHSRKCIWNCRLLIWQPFCPGEDELTKTVVIDFTETCRWLSAILQ